MFTTMLCCYDLHHLRHAKKGMLQIQHIHLFQQPLDIIYTLTLLLLDVFMIV